MKKLSTQVIYQNRWMKLREDEVQLTNGSSSVYGVVEKTDFVVIIPIENNHIYLVEQFRYPIQQRFWEFPQGSWESKADADPAEIARGELLEETGLIAGNLTKLGHLYGAYGYCTQGMHVFLASDFVQGTQSLEPEEDGLIFAKFPITQFESMLRKNEIKDGATYAAYALWQISQ